MEKRRVGEYIFNNTLIFYLNDEELLDRILGIM